MKTTGVLNETRSRVRLSVLEKLCITQKLGAHMLKIVRFKVLVAMTINEDCRLLGCDAVQFGTQAPKFRRNVSNFRVHLRQVYQMIGCHTTECGNLRLKLCYKRNEIPNAILC